MKFEQDYQVRGEYSCTTIVEVDGKGCFIRERAEGETTTIHLTPQVAKHLYLMLKVYHS